MTEYAFDVVLKGAVRLKAPSEKYARKILRDVLNCADSNLGAFPNGDPILAELSLHEDCDVHLYEVDGEAPMVQTQAYGGEELFADGDRYRIFEDPGSGWRVVRLADGAEATFHGDDSCERFRDHFTGDEMGTDDPGEQSVEADEFGDWCVDDGELPPLPKPPRYSVDGVGDDGMRIGDGPYGPFRIFDVDDQFNLPGDYESRDQADVVCNRLNGL